MTSHTTTTTRTQRRQHHHHHGHYYYHHRQDQHESTGGTIIKHSYTDMNVAADLFAVASTSLDASQKSKEDQMIVCMPSLKSLFQFSIIVSNQHVHRTLEIGLGSHGSSGKTTYRLTGQTASKLYDATMKQNCRAYYIERFHKEHKNKSNAATQPHVRSPKLKCIYFIPNQNISYCPSFLEDFFQHHLVIFCLQFFDFLFSGSFGQFCWPIRWKPIRRGLRKPPTYQRVRMIVRADKLPKEVKSQAASGSKHFDLESWNTTFLDVPFSMANRKFKHRRHSLGDVLIAVLPKSQALEWKEKTYLQSLSELQPSPPRGFTALQPAETTANILHIAVIDWAPVESIFVSRSHMLWLFKTIERLKANCNHFGRFYSTLRSIASCVQQACAVWTKNVWANIQCLVGGVARKLCNYSCQSVPMISVNIYGAYSKSMSLLPGLIFDFESTVGSFLNKL